MAAIYQTGTPPTSPAPAVRGYLGHKRPTWERADLAAKDYVQGRPIQAPTLGQLAFAYRVTVASITRRLKGNGNGQHPIPTLAEHLTNATPAERQVAARALGAEVIWDTMIQPIIEEDRPTPAK
jgi:hypothetical protein